jgi:hypothetical protein
VTDTYGKVNSFCRPPVRSFNSSHNLVLKYGISQLYLVLWIDKSN